MWAIHSGIRVGFDGSLPAGTVLWFWHLLNLNSSCPPASCRNELNSMVRGRARMISCLSNHAPKAALLTEENYCQKIENLASCPKLVAIPHFLKNLFVFSYQHPCSHQKPGHANPAQKQFTSCKASTVTPLNNAFGSILSYNFMLIWKFTECKSKWITSIRMINLNRGDFRQNACSTFPNEEVVWVKIDSLVLGSSALKPEFKTQTWTM